MNPPTNSPAHFEARAKKMTTEQLRFAIRDVKETLAIWRDEPETDYTRKLWAEWDAYVTEAHDRALAAG